MAGNEPRGELNFGASTRGTRPDTPKDKANGKAKAKPKGEPGRGSAPPPPPPAKTRAPRKPKGSGKRRRRSVLGTLVRLAAVLVLFAIIGVGGVVAYYATTLPPRSDWAVPSRPPNVAILSDNGELIANRGDTGGRALELSELPAHVPQAVIAIEDRRFRTHFGIDPIGLARAIATNLRAGSVVQGGSTLTQQLAKNLFLDPSRTLERKIQEVIFAAWLELSHSKDEILEMYLNRVYYGAGAYGIDAAAQRYFGHGAEELDLAEAALLAGTLKAPSYYAPTADLARSNARAATVLGAMRDVGFITPEEEAEALANPATVAAPTVATSGGYVADWVNDVLPQFAGAVETDIVVETTVDLELQELAQSALQELLAGEGAAKNVSQGAVVVLDSGGAVKALVGGRTYGDSQYNRAVSAERQPGSAFKPFVYLAALEYGLTPTTMRIDQPVSIDGWSPENYTREHLGPVSLTKALAVSLNTISAQLAAEVGPQRVVDVAHRLGIGSELVPNASLALGTSEVTPLELTAAYVPFSNGGVGVVPHIVRRIRSAEGTLIYERRGPPPAQVVRPNDVGAMNYMLSQALAAGTAKRARLEGWPAAGKTGTSQEFRDAWFVGYTAFFTAGVWLGNDDNSSTDRATGGSLPADLWHRLMEKVHEGMVPADLPFMDQIALEPAVVASDPFNAPSTEPGAITRDGADWAAAPTAAAEEGVGIGRFLQNIFGR